VEIAICECPHVARGLADGGVEARVLSKYVIFTCRRKSNYSIIHHSHGKYGETIGRKEGDKAV